MILSFVAGTTFAAWVAHDGRPSWNLIDRFELNAWKMVGLLGAALFGCRWLVQAAASKTRRPVNCASGLLADQHRRVADAADVLHFLSGSIPRHQHAATIPGQRVQLLAGVWQRKVEIHRHDPPPRG